MNKKIELNIDAEPWLTENGVDVFVFIGDDETPTEYQCTWDEMVQREIDAQVVYGFDDKTVFLKKDDTLDRLEKIAHSLEAGASRIYDLIDNAYIFDREAWLEANDGEYNQDNKEEFLTKVRND